MRKFIINIALFAISIIFIDYLFGIFCRHLDKNAKGGDTKTEYYIANESNADIYILGSSRASHHYISKLIEDSLKLKTYNGGLDGNGVIFQYGRLQTICNRKKPKLIIYDVYEKYDIEENDNLTYLKKQKKFYDQKGIKEIFSDISRNESLKMLSQLYRYNEAFLQMGIDNIKPIIDVQEGGFKPLYDSLDMRAAYKDKTIAISWDPIKKMYFEKFVDYCEENKIQLIVFYSPMLNAGDCNCLNEMTQYLKQKGIKLFNHYTDTDFTAKDFQDGCHLNINGANKYTLKVINEITNQFK